MQHALLMIIHSSTSLYYLACPKLEASLHVRPSRNPQIKGVNCDHFSNITSYETPIKKSLPALLPYQPVVLAILHYGITCAFSVGDSTLVLYNIGTDWFYNFVVVNK